MKNVLFGCICLIFSLSAGATEIPFHPETAAANEAAGIKKTLRVEWNASAGTNGGVAAHGLGAWLPAKAIITQSYMQIKTVFRGAGTGASTVAFHCEDANNILTAEDLYGDSAGIKAGNETGAAGAMVGSIAAPCQITATVAGYAQTSGKLVLFVDYVTGL